MLRFADVVDDTAAKPWGWADTCGRFAQPLRAVPGVVGEHDGHERRARRVHASRRDDERMEQRHRQRARRDRDDAHRAEP